MQVTFDTTNEKDVQDVQALVNMLTGGATVPAKATTKEPDEKPDTSEADAAAEEEAKKAEAAKKRKAAADKKKADEAAAKEAEEKAAAEEAEKEEDEKDEEPSVTREDVKAALKDYAALEGKDAAITILKDHGAASITELAEEKYADVIAACG
ncbi:membrane spanning protein TolA [Roseobacter phage RDJL Phi 2]|uniref:Membrane spanning protein TolA n=1 Tax=Roseobacter phage RDJL Phi 2 TaxID=1682380 RepID=A0A0K0PVI6_9CAUD|nr:membrane spanning protein TolA [Roseobacter phage RDJL Phi 2]AKQ75830.1 membrane spanning protein TolA [Roseobacter phage RDJL Phi 2]